MNQAELDAYVAAQAPGGDVNNWEFNRGTKTKEITTVSGTRTVQVPFVQWIDRKTGRTLEYEVQPGGGSYTEVFNGVKPENKKDMQNTPGSAKEGDIRGGAKDQKKRERFVNGQWVVEDNPLYEPPESNTKPQTVATNTSEPFIVERNPDNTITTRPNPNYKPPTPTTKQETIRGSDGKDYTRVTIIDPANNNAIAIKNFGPDGKQVSEIPGEGPSRPTVSGPPLPQIVLGASQDAARTYKEQLQEGVAAGRWSQAWADSRWKEFMEVANLAVSEAATRQRNEESQRNAEFNIANARMGSMNTATSNALTFVNSINGLLPAGSNLGGQAFAALLGLNMLQSQMSGMNKIDPRRAPPTLTPAEISNPAALQARREQVQTQVQQAAAPPAPAPAAAPPAQQPVAPGASPPAAPVNNPALVNTDPFDGAAPVAAPPAPSQWQPPLNQGQDLSDPAAHQPSPLNPPQPPAATPDPSIPPIQGPLVEEQAPAPAPAPSGGAFPPLPVVPRAGSEAGGNVQKAMPNPAGEWAALAPMAPMPAPTQQQQQTPTGWGEPVAARRARIASMPPWRLSEDDLAWAEQNGFGHEAWGVPGRVA